MPKTVHANTYPAHDEHPSEKTAVAIDPYDTPEKTSIFSLRYDENGFLPVLFTISNDGDKPLALMDIKIQLVTRDRTRISPAESNDIFRRITKVKRRDQQSPLPWPIPRGRSGMPKEAAAEINAATFKVNSVEPHETQSGFMFFDISNMRNPLAGAHLYITGMKDAAGTELMYFEISLDKYLNSPKTTEKK